LTGSVWLSGFQQQEDAAASTGDFCIRTDGYDEGDETGEKSSSYPCNGTSGLRCDRLVFRNGRSVVELVSTAGIIVEIVLLSEDCSVAAVSIIAQRRQRVVDDTIW